MNEQTRGSFGWTVDLIISFKQDFKVNLPPLGPCSFTFPVSYLSSVTKKLESELVVIHIDLGKKTKN